MKVVRYIGTADVRVITSAEWSKVKVTKQATVRWDRTNNFTVPASDLTAAAVQYCENDDDGFVVVGK